MLLGLSIVVSALIAALRFLVDLRGGHRTAYALIVNVDILVFSRYSLILIKAVASGLVSLHRGSVVAWNNSGLSEFAHAFVKFDIQLRSSHARWLLWRWSLCLVLGLREAIDQCAWIVLPRSTALLCGVQVHLFYCTVVIAPFNRSHLISLMRPGDWLRRRLFDSD